VEGATIHYAGRKVGELVSPTELNAASIGWDGDAIGSSLSHDLSLPSESTAHSYRKYIVRNLNMCGFSQTYILELSTKGRYRRTTMRNNKLK
jgi:hypothetical protein